MKSFKKRRSHLEQKSHFGTEERFQQFRRILFVEKFLMLPVKTVLVLGSILFVRALLAEGANEEAIFLQYQIFLYMLGNLIFIYSILKIGQKKLQLNVVRVSSFFLSIMDSLFLSFLIYLSDGIDSPLYLAYIGLMVRNAVNFPKIQIQGIINLSCCIFYVGAVIISEGRNMMFFQEVFFLRVFVLLLMSGCCWGIYALVRQKEKKQEETEEMAFRKDKMLGLGRLAGEIAHEIKNPLSIVNNAAYYISKHIRPDQEEVVQQIKTIQDEVARADKILTDILDYSKLSNIRISRIDVPDLINEIADSVKTQFYNKDVEVKKVFEKELPELLMDEGQFRQIILNLVKNAFEAIPSENGMLIIKVRYLPGGYIQIQLLDNGPGLDDEYEEQLFAPFYTTKEDGTGLGLAIVKNIIESYNGKIKIENRGDAASGAIITMLIPVHTPWLKHRLYSKTS